jgi:hypothetical protein
MAMLADSVEVVIGVDTHKHTHTAAVLAAREVLGRDQLAQPRATGPRAALSVRLAARRSVVQAAGDAQRQLHALVIAAPRVPAGTAPNPPLDPPAGGGLRPAARPPGTLSPPPWPPSCRAWPVGSES